MRCLQRAGPLCTFPRIISLYQIPITRRRFVSDQPQQRFEGNVPIKSAIVAKHEFIEIGIDVLAAQSVIGAEAPSFHQRKCPVDPRQNNVRGHLAYDARIVPIAFQARKGFVTIREQRGSALHVGFDERLDRRGARNRGCHPVHRFHEIDQGKGIPCSVE